MSDLATLQLSLDLLGAAAYWAADHQAEAAEVLALCGTLAKQSGATYEQRQDAEQYGRRLAAQGVRRPLRATATFATFVATLPHVWLGPDDGGHTGSKQQEE